MNTMHSLRHRLLLLVLPFALLGAGRLTAQAVFTVNNLAPDPSGGAHVDIFAADPLFHNPGPVEGGITGVTFGTNIRFYSPGPSFGASDPGFFFNGAISGTSITAGAAVPISYAFTMAKNSGVGGNVSWVLSFADNVNTTPTVIGSGTLSTASATFTGSGTNYTFTNGAPATFYASLALTYTTGMAMQNPEINVTMLDTGYGGQGITLNTAAIPEPSTYAAIVGALALGLVAWRRRQAAAAGAA